MANTFPSAGNVGIGTTSPLAPLHVYSGSAILALFQGQPGGTERAYIQLTSSNADYTWQISNQDASFGNTSNSLAFVETTLPQTPVAVRVYFQEGGQVGVGTTSPGSAQLAVANSGGTSVVQFQPSGSAPGAIPALSIGYGGTYNGSPIYDLSPIQAAGYIQADKSSAPSYPPLFLNPFGGNVSVGLLQGAFQPPDQYPAGTSFNRFRVNQNLSSGNAGGNSMVSYTLNTLAGVGSDSAAASFYVTASGNATNNGAGSVRALEVQAMRAVPQASGSVTQSLYLGLGSTVSGSGLALPPLNVGAFINSAPGSGVGGVRNDAAVWITGMDGWYYGLLYDDGNNNGLFWVLSDGDMYAAKGNFQVDPDGNVLIEGTLGAANAVSNYPSYGLFHVDSGGNAYATSFNVSSSKSLKKDIRELTCEEATKLLDGLDPVRFRYKRVDDREHFGFIAENTPPELAPSGTGVSVMDLMAVLTRVAKDQHREIETQVEMNRYLREKLQLLKQHIEGKDDSNPESLAGAS